MIGLGQMTHKYVVPFLISRILGLTTIQNPMNWPGGKRFFVTSEICLLTFSVYVGSAIYTVGIRDV